MVAEIVVCWMVAETGVGWLLRLALLLLVAEVVVVAGWLLRLVLVVAEFVVVVDDVGC